MKPLKVAVIGAGLAGLSAAFYLKKAGVDVTVFEKNMIPGGRLLSIVNVKNEVDLGAQYCTLRSILGQQLLHDWQAQDFIQRWSPKLYVINQGRLSEKEGEETVRWVGVPTMASLVHYFTKDIRLLCGWEVTGVTRKVTGDWQILTQAGDCPDGYQAVLLALPAPLISQLVKNERPNWLSSLDKVQFLPTYGALVRFDVDPEFDAAFINDGIGRWLANNSSKPGRPPGLGWTLHLDHQWSMDNRHLDFVTLRERILEHWQKLNLPYGLRNIEPFYWPHALSLPTFLNTPWDRDLKIGALGDWLQGGRVEGALLAGHQLSQSVLEDNWSS